VTKDVVNIGILSQCHNLVESSRTFYFFSI